MILCHSEASSATCPARNSWTGWSKSSHRPTTRAVGSFQGWGHSYWHIRILKLHLRRSLALCTTPTQCKCQWGHTHNSQKISSSPYKHHSFNVQSSVHYGYYTPASDSQTTKSCSMSLLACIRVQIHGDELAEAHEPWGKKNEKAKEEPGKHALAGDDFS
jgi:hypothetical protein